MWIFGLTGKSGFSARNTAEQVTKGVDGTGLVAIVTGMFLFLPACITHKLCVYVISFFFSRQAGKLM